jgi:hypothetical protein
MRISPLSSRQRTWLRWCPALFLAIIIFYFSSMPGDEVGKTYNSLDTIALPAATASATVAIITQATPREIEATKPHLATVVAATSKATATAIRPTAATTALPFSQVVRKIPIFSRLDLLKAGHAIGYFWLGLTILYALGIQSHRSPIMAVTLCTLYAVSDEFHQRFIPGRSATARDILIDTLASLVGVVVFLALIKTMSAFRQTQAPPDNRP